MRYTYLILNIFFLFYSIEFVIGQTTLIPDAAFEQKLIDLGIDSDNAINGQVLTADIAGVSFLDISGTLSSPGTIQDLTGIEDFSLLSYLDCSFNSITSLNFGFNSSSNLQTIYCQNNQIASINLFFVNNLAELNCANNLLTNIDLSMNFNLSKLYCNQNLLSSIDVSNNAFLTELNCAVNPITTIDVSNNTLLESLDCAYSQLSNLDLSNNSNLVWLRCQNNQLHFLDVSNNPLIYQILTQDNLLDSIKISNNPLLRGLSFDNNKLVELDLSSCPQLEVLTCSNNQLFYLNVQNGNNANVVNFNAINNTPGLSICVDNKYIIPAHWNKDITATYSDICHATLIGLVKQDINNNCITDLNEPPLANQIIRITHPVGTVYSTSNSLGKYIAELDSGTYTLDVIPFGPYWTACPSSQNVTIDTSSIDTVNWAMQPIVECPFLTVGISAPFLRMTGGGSYYTVNYCNYGTAIATNPYVEVKIDSFLNVTGSNIPIYSQNGNTYTFLLDTLDIDECGSFNVNVIVSQNAQLQQTHCSEAHIFPDSICLPIWNGPIINASGSCQNDTIYFKLKNTGSNMLLAHNYSIFEDDIILRINPFTLGSGDSILIAQVANIGKTYRIETNQALGFPAMIGSSIAYAAIEGCNPFSNGTFNTGFVTPYYTGSTAPFLAIDCQQNVASFDPNDKSAQNQGYGSQHYILPNTPLNYRVRFQNTGNDTAFHIVIIDTLSPYVDITTLQMGASSHNYTWELLGARVLVLTFDNILLVDSNTNEALSHGFFSYQIQQLPNLSNGIIINNQAAIYFDYNPPIFTNTTFHTINDNFVPIVLSVQETWVEDLQIHLYPNPTNGFIYINQLKTNTLHIIITNQLGRVISQQTSSDFISRLDLSDLPTGVYYLSIHDGQKSTTQKVIKQN